MLPLEKAAAALRVGALEQAEVSSAPASRPIRRCRSAEVAHAVAAAAENPEAEVRRLLAFLDLPFDEACLRFSDNPRAVHTPSAEQVRRPIYSDALHHWRNYEPWLGPLKAGLGPLAEPSDHAARRSPADDIE